MLCMVRALIGLPSVPVGFLGKHCGVLNAKEKVQVGVRARRAQLLGLGRRLLRAAVEGYEWEWYRIGTLCRYLMVVISHDAPATESKEIRGS